MPNAQDFNGNQPAPVHKNVVGVTDKFMRACYAAVPKNEQLFDQEFQRRLEVLRLACRQRWGCCPLCTPDAGDVLECAFKPDDGQHVLLLQL